MRTIHVNVRVAPVRGALSHGNRLLKLFIIIIIMSHGEASFIFAVYRLFAQLSTACFHKCFTHKTDPSARIQQIDFMGRLFCLLLNIPISLSTN